MTSISEQIINNTNMSASAKAASSSSSSSTSSTSSSSSSSVSSQQFLNLMCMQLQYQDPTDPTDNSEMLAQEAQFSSLEAMENLNSSFNEFSSRYQANALMGKTVEVDSDGNTTKGQIEYIDYSDTNGASVSINGKLYPLSSISKVYSDETAQSDSSSDDSSNSSFISEALSSIANNIGYLTQKAAQAYGDIE